MEVVIFVFFGAVFSGVVFVVLGAVLWSLKRKRKRGIQHRAKSSD